MSCYSAFVLGTLCDTQSSHKCNDSSDDSWSLGTRIQTNLYSNVRPKVCELIIWKILVFIWFYCYTFTLPSHLVNMTENNKDSGSINPGQQTNPNAAPNAAAKDSGLPNNGSEAVKKAEKPPPKSLVTLDIKPWGESTILLGIVVIYPATHTRYIRWLDWYERPRVRCARHQQRRSSVGRFYACSPGIWYQKATNQHCCWRRESLSHWAARADRRVGRLCSEQRCGCDAKAVTIDLLILGLQLHSRSKSLACPCKPIWLHSKIWVKSPLSAWSSQEQMFQVLSRCVHAPCYPSRFGDIGSRVIDLAWAPNTMLRHLIISSVSDHFEVKPLDELMRRRPNLQWCDFYRDVPLVSNCVSQVMSYYDSCSMKRWTDCEIEKLKVKVEHLGQQLELHNVGLTYLLPIQLSPLIITCYMLSLIYSQISKLTQ